MAQKTGVPNSKEVKRTGEKPIEVYSRKQHRHMIMKVDVLEQINANSFTPVPYLKEGPGKTDEGLFKFI